MGKGDDDLDQQMSSTLTNITIQLAQRQIPIPRDDVIKYLGSYLGEEKTESKHLLDSISESEYQKMSKLAQTDKQLCMLILRQCYSRSTAHIARLMPPSTTEDALEQMDSTIANVLFDILELNEIDHKVLDQSRLPINMGGLSLPSLYGSRCTAYFASIMKTIDNWCSFINDDHPFLKHWLTPPWKENGQLRSKATQSSINLDKSLKRVRAYIDMTADSQAANLTVSTSVVNAGDLKHIKKSPFASRLPTSMAGLTQFKDIKKLQHRITQFAQTVDFQKFEATYIRNQAQKAHFLSKTGPHATAFLQTVQSERAMTFHNREFLVILYTYLQIDVLPLFKASPNTPCACGQLDSTKKAVLCTQGHLLNCGAKNDFTRRHDAIKEILMEMFRAANLFPVAEKQCDIGSGKFSRFDISVENILHEYKVLNMDLTIPNPLAKKIVAEAAKTPMAAAEHYVHLKNAKYSQYVTHDNFFSPAVIETFGAVHPFLANLIRRASIKVNHVPPERATWTASTFAQYYFQRISCTLQKMNAQSITNVVTNSANLAKSSHSNGKSPIFKTSAYMTEADVDQACTARDQNQGPEPQFKC